MVPKTQKIKQLTPLITLKYDKVKKLVYLLSTIKGFLGSFIKTHQTQNP
jgi:hypothetical protein